VAGWICPGPPCNHGRDPDTLVRVSSPIAAGSIRVADGLTIPAGHTLTAGQAGLAGVSTSHEDGDNTVALTGLREPIRSGLTYPVVVGFERAGDLILDVPVHSPDVTR
jgi:copper(I)-binding protein